MALENDFLAGALGRIVPFTGASRGWPGVAYGHRAIELTHDLPVRRQAELLNISRANVYYLPRPISTVDLALMRRIERLA